jgi:hypothetical protein
VDPLYKSYPWNSSYSFAENDVIRSIDLDGLEKYIIYQRSFAPWRYFGAAFGNKYSGDNRGFTILTSNDIHSKVSTAITLDLATTKAAVTDALQHGNTTRYDESTGKVEATAPNVVPLVLLWRPQKDGIVTKVKTRLEGKAPFSPMPVMDFAKAFFNDPITWTATTTIENNISKGYINVKYSFYGKGFPALEAFVQDQKGTKIFIGIYESPAKSNIIDRLSGTEFYMAQTFLTKIVTDKAGNFLGVSENIGGKEVVISPNVYNKKIESYPAAPDLSKP